MIVGFVGLIGSGKDTAADLLVNDFGFKRDSFANTLKDAVSKIFHWDRDMLQGLSAESRAWREEVDDWWAERLGIPHLTPRWVLQFFGTDVCRDYFSNDIWVASLERKLMQSKDNVVISDVRFANEAQSILKQPNGMIITYEASDDVLRDRIFKRDGVYMTDEQLNHNSEKEIDLVKEISTFIINTDNLSIEDQAKATLQIVKNQIETLGE